jgi:hypothetical protein
MAVCIQAASVRQRSCGSLSSASTTSALDLTALPRPAWVGSMALRCTSRQTRELANRPDGLGAPDGLLNPQMLVGRER